MARDGSGNYSKPEPDFQYEEVIDEGAVNHNFDDIATALTGSIASDGQTPIVANLPMGGFRHTGVGNAAARTDYASAGQVQNDAIVWCGTAGGTVNALTLAPSIPISTYVAGQRFRFLGNGFNTDSVTLAVSGQAAKALWQDGANLVRDTIWTGALYEAVYDGTRFHLITLGAAASSTGRNYFVNPGFRVAQQGETKTITTGNEGYVLDQWFVSCISASANTVAEKKYEAGGIAALPHSQIEYLRLTSANHGRLTQPVPDVMLFAGRAVTLTFWAKASVAGATITPYVYQFFGSGGSSAILTAVGDTKVLTTGWLRYRSTFTVPAVSPSATLGAGHCTTFRLDLDGDNIAIDFAYMQLEMGSRYSFIQPAPFQDDLNAARHFWQSSYPYGSAPGTNTDVGNHHSFCSNVITPSQNTLIFAPHMRVGPSVSIYTPSGTIGNFRDVDAAEDRPADVQYTSQYSCVLFATDNSLIPGNRLLFHYVADARIS